MAVAKIGKTFYLRIRPFSQKQVNVKTHAETKTEALRIERSILTAFDSGDYDFLDPASRSVCVNLFKNQQWEMPPGLCRNIMPSEELTMWKAVEIFFKYPEIRQCHNRSRHEFACVHLVSKFGKDFPIKTIWIPEIKKYQIERLDEGAAASTVNKEKSTLSRIFGVLVELKLVDINPVRMVKNLSEKSGEREVYVSFNDFGHICRLLPDWFRPIALTAFYTGMRRGEILGLTTRHVKLRQRMILLGPEDVKEGHWKRIPIHSDLLPVLEQVSKIMRIGDDHIFHLEGRVPNKHSLRKPWRMSVGSLGFNPAPRFHDLRHTWKTNARRSGMDPEIRESIMGHWYRGKNVSERYGRISDAELIQAIDLMSFDHGPTEIQLASSKRNPTQSTQLNRKNVINL